MWKLFTILIILILPLSVKSQEKPTDIERTEKNKWILSNDAVQAYYYLSVEKDSLVKEVEQLRAQNEELKKERDKILEVVLQSVDDSKELIKERDSLTTEKDKVDESILDYFKRQSQGLRLDLEALATLDNQSMFIVRPKLYIPITNSWDFTTQVDITPSFRPRYQVGVSLNLF